MEDNPRFYVTVSQYRCHWYILNPDTPCNEENNGWCRRLCAQNVFGYRSAPEPGPFAFAAFPTKCNGCRSCLAAQCGAITLSPPIFFSPVTDESVPI